MAQYKLAHIDMKGNRGELHDLLNLTGAEVSCNTLPAGASVPFVHHHTQNEELYLILEGKGMLYIDGEEVPLKEGDCFRIDPQGERCLRAADDSAMRFICIQAKAGSLEGFTMSDAVVTEASRAGCKPLHRRAEAAPLQRRDGAFDAARSLEK